MEVPSSEHIIKYAYKWPLEKAIDLSIEATLSLTRMGSRSCSSHRLFAREMKWCWT